MEQKSTRICKTRDYYFSKEEFEILLDERLQIGKTAPLVPESEVERYYAFENYTSYSKRKGLFQSVYRIVRGFMFSVKARKIGLLKQKGFRALDYGCGTGEFLGYLRKRSFSCDGVESNDMARRSSEWNKYIYPSLASCQKERYDLVSMWHVLEHIYEPLLLLENLRGMLKEGGRLVVAVPNFKSYDAKHYSSFWAAYDVPRHVWHFSQEGLENMCSKQGFVLKKKFPLWFDSFYVSILSERYKKSRFPYIKGLFFGSISNVRALFTTEFSSISYVFVKKG